MMSKLKENLLKFVYVFSSALIVLLLLVHILWPVFTGFAAFKYLLS